jgi:hypothetical protein
MNRIVNLTKRVKTAQGLRYLPVALSSNGRVKPDVVIVNGEEERHPGRPVSCLGSSRRMPTDGPAITTQNALGETEAGTR